MIPNITPSSDPTYRLPLIHHSVVPNWNAPSDLQSYEVLGCIPDAERNEDTPIPPLAHSLGQRLSCERFHALITKALGKPPAGSQFVTVFDPRQSTFYHEEEIPMAGAWYNLVYDYDPQNPEHRTYARRVQRWDAPVPVTPAPNQEPSNAA